MKNFAIQIMLMTALEARRGMLFWIALAIVLAAAGIAQFLSQVALTEAREIQATLLGAFLRACGAFVMATFVITSMVREAGDRVMELLLSQPIPRWVYLAGKLCGYAAVAMALALLFTLVLAAIAPWERALLWGVAFACELLIVTGVSLFCVLSLTHVVPALAATAGFYVLSRSMSTMQVIAAAPIGGSDTWVDSTVRAIVDAIALLLPALDSFTSSAWLVASRPAMTQLAGIAAQTAIYLALISIAALFDLSRKNF